MQVRQKVEKSPKAVFSKYGGSTSRLAKAAGAGGDERWETSRHCGGKHMSKSKCQSRLML